MDSFHSVSGTEAIALAAFLVSFLVFLLILLGITRLPAERLRQLEQFPLHKETTTSHEQPSKP